MELRPRSIAEWAAAILFLMVATVHAQPPNPKAPSKKGPTTVERGRAVLPSLRVEAREIPDLVKRWNRQSDLVTRFVGRDTGFSIEVLQEARQTALQILSDPEQPLPKDHSSIRASKFS